MCDALIYLLAFRDFEVAVLTPFPCICLLLSTEHYKRPLASRHVTNLRTAHRCDGCEEAAPHWTSKKKTSRQWCVTRTHISDIIGCSRVKWQTDLCWWLGKDFVLKMYGYEFTMVLSSGSVYRSAYIYIYSWITIKRRQRLCTSIWSWNIVPQSRIDQSINTQSINLYFLCKACQKQICLTALTNEDKVLHVDDTYIKNTPKQRC